MEAARNLAWVDVFCVHGDALDSGNTVPAPEARRGVMQIPWTPDLVTGVEEIDSQHQELFRHVEELLNACNAGRGKREVLRTMVFLADYVVRHFAAEERLMVQNGFPGFQEHQANHAAFKATLTGMKARLAEDGVGLPLVLEVNELVVDWLVRHIRKMDQELAAHLRSKA